jgi:hypothetical protein
MQALDPHISTSTQDWAPVKDLIEEIQQQELFAAAFFQWDLVVRYFRRIEKAHFLDQAPISDDLRYHKAALLALLSVGQYLVIASARFSDEDLVAFAISKENMLAYIRELEHSYIEWHGELSDETRAELNRRIFGAAP